MLVWRLLPEIVHFGLDAIEFFHHLVGEKYKNLIHGLPVPVKTEYQHGYGNQERCRRVRHPPPESRADPALRHTNYAIPFAAFHASICAGETVDRANRGRNPAITACICPSSATSAASSFWSER